MKTLIFCLSLTIAAVIGNVAYASSEDDAKWTAQCIKDNEDAKVSQDIVKAYCACMVEKMEDSEMQTVTQWEKKHVKERKECEKKSGWE